MTERRPDDRAGEQFVHGLLRTEHSPLSPQRRVDDVLAAIDRGAVPRAARRRPWAAIAVAAAALLAVLAVWYSLPQASEDDLSTLLERAAAANAGVDRRYALTVGQAEHDALWSGTLDVRDATRYVLRATIGDDEVLAGRTAQEHWQVGGRAAGHEDAGHEHAVQLTTPASGSLTATHGDETTTLPTPDELLRDLPDLYRRITTEPRAGAWVVTATERTGSGGGLPVEVRIELGADLVAQTATLTWPAREGREGEHGHEHEHRPVDNVVLLLQERPSLPADWFERSTHARRRR